MGFSKTIKAFEVKVNWDLMYLNQIFNACTFVEIMHYNCNTGKENIKYFDITHHNQKTADCEWMSQIWLMIRYTQIDLFPELTLGHAIKVFISDSLQIIRFTICTATAFQAINISFVNNSFKFWFISWIYFDPTWVYDLD